MHDWTDIVSISAADLHTVGLKSDGTVVATGSLYYGKCDVSTWTDIVAVAAGYYHTVGLKSDGTVVAVGDNSEGQCDVSEWKNIVAICADAYHTVGLKSDGTVVATGFNEDGRCDVSSWDSIVAVTTGFCHTIGLKNDGTIVIVGNISDSMRDASGWTQIKIPESKDYSVDYTADPDEIVSAADGLTTLSQHLDFNQVWQIKDHTDGGYYVTDYAFEADGTCYCAFHFAGEFTESSPVTGYYGTYTFSGNALTFHIWLGDHWVDYTYDFDPATLGITQTSETALHDVQIKGDSYVLQPDKYMPMDLMRKIVNDTAPAMP